MVTQYIQRDLECENKDHEEHLCYLVSQGFHLSDAETFKVLTNNPKFQCKHCGRGANKSKNLCVPQQL